MERLTMAAADVAERVPSYRLGFRPEASVIDLCLRAATREAARRPVAQA
jgi:hypothetical protein